MSPTQFINSQFYSSHAKFANIIGNLLCKMGLIHEKLAMTHCRLLPTCINDDIVEFSWLTYIICRAGYYPNRMREVGNPILFFTPYRRHLLTYVARSSSLTRDLCINRSQSYRGACSHSNANKVKKEVERKRLTSLQK